MAARLLQAEARPAAERPRLCIMVGGGIGWSDVRPSPQPDVSITRRSSFPARSLARIVSNHPPKNSSQRKIGQERMGQRATTLRVQGRGPPADPEQSRSPPQILLADGHLRNRPPLFHKRSRAALAWCEPSLVENRSLARVLPCAVQPAVVLCLWVCRCRKRQAPSDGTLAPLPDWRGFFCGRALRNRLWYGVGGFAVNSHFGKPPFG